ncbi:MAG: hypothetical protein ABI743_00695 [bacterium]
MQLRCVPWFVFSALATLAISGLGCADDNAADKIIDDNGREGQRKVMAAQFQNLPTLAVDYHYDLWAVRERDVAVFVPEKGTPFRVGSFRVLDDGTAVDLSGVALPTSSNGVNFETDAELVGTGEVFVSIEPNDDAFPNVVNGPKMLSGTFANDGALMNLDFLVRADHPSAAIVPLDQSGAFFILITPSDDTSNAVNNNNFGVHFVSASLKTGEASLLIPPSNAPNMELGTLPNSAQYEAWVVEDVNGRLAATNGEDRSQARFISAGTFSDPQGNAADGDGLGPQAGTDLSGAAGVPSWVGSDFVTQGPLGHGDNLTTGRWIAAISIEPVPDNDPAHPWAVLLYRQLPSGLATGSGNVHSMQNTFDVDNHLFSPPAAVLKLLP